MTWCYIIHAVPGQRLLMRIAQIFDQQQLTPDRLQWKLITPEQVKITLCLDCEEQLARRLHAKLFHLKDLLSVELSSVPANSKLNSQADSPVR